MGHEMLLLYIVDVFDIYFFMIYKNQVVIH